MSNALILETVNNVAVVRFNRPDIRSPLSIVVLDELHRRLDRMDNKKALIFTGCDDVFASGADLREVAGITPETAREFALLGQSLMNRIADLSIPTVAAVNGYCFGGALDLALACDKRFASPNASFAHPGANLGIMTGWGGTQRLPRLVGEATALEMFFTAKRVSAAEAQQIGLVDAISDSPYDRALEAVSV